MQDGGRGTALAVKDDGAELDVEVDLFLLGDFTGIAGVHGGVGSWILLLAGGVEAHRGGEEKSRENVVDDAFHDSMVFIDFLSVEIILRISQIAYSICCERRFKAIA